jgi:hypothetical protein
MKTKLILSKFAVLTLIGVCLLHCLELDWARECITGHVTCEPTCTENLCLWTTVLRSVYYVGKRLTCRELPNNLFLFPYCMVSINPVFPLQCRIRVYCLVCITHTLKSGYWFLHIVCSLYVFAIDLLDCPTYELLQVLHLSLFIPLEFMLVLTILSVSCWCVVFWHAGLYLIWCVWKD